LGFVQNKKFHQIEVGYYLGLNPKNSEVLIDMKDSIWVVLELKYGLS
jgi:hypothetical protein